LYADARQAAQAMTHVEPTPFEPDPTRSAFYSRLYEQVYRHLFSALQPYLDRLTELAESMEAAAIGNVSRQDANGVE
jgi:ribulose kinase